MSVGEKYMVSVAGGNAPRQLHTTLELAEQEAIRLATKHPGNVVTILQVVRQVIGKIRVVEYPHDQDAGEEL